MGVVKGTHPGVRVWVPGEAVDAPGPFRVKVGERGNAVLGRPERLGGVSGGSWLARDWSVCAKPSNDPIAVENATCLFMVRSIERSGNCLSIGIDCTLR